MQIIQIWWLSPFLPPIGYKGKDFDLYRYVRNAPTVKSDPSGLGGVLTPGSPTPGHPTPILGTPCGKLKMGCDSGAKQWPVYGDASLGYLLNGADGCVTLAPPNVLSGQEMIVCSATCDVDQRVLTTQEKGAISRRMVGKAGRNERFFSSAVVDQRVLTTEEKGRDFPHNGGENGQK
jgi:hypothetical protein